MRLLRRVAREYGWIHTVLGLIGNGLFLAGSVMFLRESTMTAGVWMFVFGASGMLLDSIGEALVRLERSGDGSEDGSEDG